MKTAVYANYKLTRYEGKGFLRNLNLRIHRDITGERCGLGVGGFSDLFINNITIGSDDPISFRTTLSPSLYLS